MPLLASNRIGREEGDRFETVRAGLFQHLAGLVAAQALQAQAGETRTMIFYESPQRIAAFLAERGVLDRRDRRLVDGEHRVQRR